MNDNPGATVETVNISRRDSMAESLETGSHFEENMYTKGDVGCSMLYSLIENFWCSFKPILVQRAINGFIICLIMLLILYGNSDNMNTLTGASGNVNWIDWYKFAGFIFAVNTLCCVLDILFFMFIDKYVNGPIFYYIDTYRYQGSLAVILTVIATDTSHKHLAVPRSIASWGDVMAAVAVIALCYILKQYIQRANYGMFIVSRFSERVKRMDVHRVILSRLASWKAFSDVPVTFNSKPEPIVQQHSDVNDSVVVDDDLLAVLGDMNAITNKNNWRSLSSSPLIFGRTSDNANTSNFPGTGTGAEVEVEAGSFTVTDRDSIKSLPNQHPFEKKFSGIDIDISNKNTTNSNSRIRSNSDPIAASTSTVSFAPTNNTNIYTSKLASEAMNKLKLLNSVGMHGEMTMKGWKAKFEADKLKEKMKRSQKDLEFISSPADIFSELIDDEDNDTAAQTKSSDTLVRKSFWRQYKVAAAGELRLTTLAGTVVIRDTKQAREFGKKLYYHLRRGYYYKRKNGSRNAGTATTPATPERYTSGMATDSMKTNCPKPTIPTIPTIPISNPNPINFQLNANSLKEILKECMINYEIEQENDPTSQERKIDGIENSIDDFDWMLRACYEQFHCDVDAESKVTESRVVEACVQLYREFKYMALSLSDNSRLRNSINNVTDVGFWLLMFVVGQIILRVDPLLVITPLLSIILLLSFALGTVLGNIFLAIGFVIFMLPFDVGDGVIIGYTNRIQCNILSVNLLTTEVVTLHNQKLSIPNHVLYSEKIINLQQSKHAVFEIPVSFCLSGPGATSMKKIELFWILINEYLNKEKRDEWKDGFVSLHTLDATRNNIGYTYWVTSRWSFFQFEKIYTNRRVLIEKMVEIQRSLGIEYMTVTNPVEIVSKEEVN